MADTVVVEGLEELLRATNQISKDVARATHTDLKQIAEPVRREAEELARSTIRKIGEPWSKMRTGANVRLVYVAPVQRGIKTRGNDPRRRPNLANLLMDRAMEPALSHNEPSVLAGIDRLVDKALAGWET